MGKKTNEADMAVPDDSEEEKEFLEAYEKGELVPVENQEEIRKKLRDAARATIEKTME